MSDTTITNTDGNHHGFNPAGSQSQNRTETWLTPPAVLNSLGGSDAFCFDPCAAPEPRPWPTAQLHNSEADSDGLTLDWPTEGVVWCNPPYDDLKGWAKRCSDHKAAGGSVILLIFNRTETRAFQDHILPNADLLHLLRGRLRFCNADGVQGASATAPSVLIALGDDAAALLRTCTYPGYAFAPATPSEKE